MCICIFVFNRKFILGLVFLCFWFDKYLFYWFVCKVVLGVGLIKISCKKLVLRNVKIMVKSFINNI